MTELRHDKWVGTTYGNSFMHRWLIKLLKVIDVRLVYWFASLLVVPPTLILSGKGRRPIYRYFRQRHGFSKWKSAWLTYRNFCVFAKVVIDRFAMYAGKRFEIEFDGYDHWQSLSARPSGFVQLSSHIGNYELAGYSLRAEDKRFNALVFGGEKETVMANRAMLFDSNNIRMIPMQADMSHLFTIDKALSDGEILSMPADRIFGSQKSFSVTFLGAQAKLPQGPFTIAALRETPIVYVVVMKTGAKRYQITIRSVEAPIGLTGKQKAKALADSYARLLEETVRQHPTQWFNYFDFWNND